MKKFVIIVGLILLSVSITAYMLREVTPTYQMTFAFSSDDGNVGVGTMSFTCKNENHCFSDARKHLADKYKDVNVLNFEKGAK